jgi:hypothetical protein
MLQPHPGQGGKTIHARGAGEGDRTSCTMAGIRCFFIYSTAEIMFSA